MNTEEEDYLADLRTERNYYQRRNALLMQAPDCRDPAHPGCEKCLVEENQEKGEVLH